MELYEIILLTIGPLLFLLVLIVIIRTLTFKPEIFAYVSSKHKVIICLYNNPAKTTITAETIKIIIKLPSDTL